MAKHIHHSRRVLLGSTGLVKPAGGLILPPAKRIEGIIPPHMHSEILRRSHDPVVLELIRKTRALTHRLLNESPDPVIFSRTVGQALRQIFDAHDQEDLEGVKVRQEGQAPIGEKDADLAYELTGIVRDYYNSIHGWNSIDGAGMDLFSIVHYGSKFNNAFWNGAKMVYGRGDQLIFATFLVLNVIGHELTHGVTQFTGAFDYWGQSGALNEHLSDVFGKIIEAWKDKLITDSDRFDWVIGRGVFVPGVNGEGIRNMLHPGTAYNDSMLGKDPQPDHMSRYAVTRADRGGVHRNSGIPNRAFALFAIAAGGYTFEAPALIWFAARALAAKATNNSPSFAQFAFYTLEAADQLGYAKYKDYLVKAWDVVGITPSASDVDDKTPARQPDLGDGE